MSSLCLPDLSKPAFTLFPGTAENIRAGLCPLCAAPIREGDFVDELSRKEFGVSGMCQACQDKTFGKPRVAKKKRRGVGST